MRALGDRATESAPPKIARLDALLQAGHAVPPGWVFDANDRPPSLEVGPWIVRMAIFGEDEATGSAAGLGLSIANVTGDAAIAAAFTAIARHAGDPWLIGYLGRAPRYQVLVQRQIRRTWLLVALLEPDMPAYIEVFGPAAGDDPLASGASPTWAGPASEWRDAPSSLAPALARFDPTSAPHGLDLEVVIDAAGVSWVVQARPLARPAHDYAAFDRERTLDADRALPAHLTLDAEHNPAPLSTAHAWVIDRLRAERGARAGDPYVVAGWLYSRASPRSLAARRPDSERVEPRAALVALHERWIPSARERLHALRSHLQASEPRNTAKLLEQAWADFVGMIDTYIEVLIPARRLAGPAGRGDVARRFSLWRSAADVGVLPTAWDIESPAIAGWVSPGVDPIQADLPDAPEDVATLLSEWDDHLFALGLAGLSAVWRWAARWSGFAAEDVFFLNGDELPALATDPDLLRARIETRRAARTRRAKLVVPPRIVNGVSMPDVRASSSKRRLAGFCVGPSFQGPLWVVPSLEGLLRHPPPSEDAVVALPALTAQAALALEQLNVAAVCTEHGGATSHGALMARELNLSALLGCRGCTELPSGTRVRIDTQLGRLFVLR